MSKLLDSVNALMTFNATDRDKQNIAIALAEYTSITPDWSEIPSWVKYVAICVDGTRYYCDRKMSYDGNGRWNPPHESRYYIERGRSIHESIPVGDCLFERPLLSTIEGNRHYERIFGNRPTGKIYYPLGQQHE